MAELFPLSLGGTVSFARDCAVPASDWEKIRSEAARRRFPIYGLVQSCVVDTSDWSRGAYSRSVFVSKRGYCSGGRRRSGFVPPAGVALCGIPAAQHTCLPGQSRQEEAPEPRIIHLTQSLSHSTAVSVPDSRQGSHYGVWSRRLDGLQCTCTPDLQHLRRTSRYSRQSSRDLGGNQYSRILSTERTTRFVLPSRYTLSHTPKVALYSSRMQKEHVCSVDGVVASTAGYICMRRSCTTLSVFREQLHVYC